MRFGRFSDVALDGTHISSSGDGMVSVLVAVCFTSVIAVAWFGAVWLLTAHLAHAIGWFGRSTLRIWYVGVIYIGMWVLLINIMRG